MIEGDTSFAASQDRMKIECWARVVTAMDTRACERLKERSKSLEILFRTVPDPVIRTHFSLLKRSDASRGFRVDSDFTPEYNRVEIRMAALASFTRNNRSYGQQPIDSVVNPQRERNGLDAKASQSVSTKNRVYHTLSADNEGLFQPAKESVNRDSYWFTNSLKEMWGQGSDWLDRFPSRKRLIFDNRVHNLKIRSPYPAASGSLNTPRIASEADFLSKSVAVLDPHYPRTYGVVLIYT
ncbi:hypothetical protein ANCCEY_04359 [Ancylostoma ceylanicum]|uniref:Uncharacterized protein n=1 Tax=Ancylostoma ceylanicum TaxID=53326 RepID=A0A0D6LWZ2_9BILA|nr:hypothetical protein ANCCEY_04359 [Ancylostoma ceylanicum]